MAEKRLAEEFIENGSDRSVDIFPERVENLPGAAVAVEDAEGMEDEHVLGRALKAHVDTARYLANRKRTVL